jgi:hypothetical protein
MWHLSYHSHIQALYRGSLKNAGEHRPRAGAALEISLYFVLNEATIRERSIGAPRRFFLIRFKRGLFGPF